MFAVNDDDPMDIDEAISCEDKIVQEIGNKRKGIEDSLNPPEKKVCTQQRSCRKDFYNLAANYKQLGIITMPLQRYKRPLLKGWTKLTKTPAASKWRGSHGIGLVCGKNSNLTVVDLDKVFSNVSDELDGIMFMENLLQQTETEVNWPIVISPTGGKHYYFKHVPELKNGAKLKVWKGIQSFRNNEKPFRKVAIDIRSQGGYIVGAETPYSSDKKEKSQYCGQPYRFKTPLSWQSDMRNLPDMPSVIKKLFTHGIILEQDMIIFESWDKQKRQRESKTQNANYQSVSISSGTELSDTKKKQINSSLQETIRCILENLDSNRLKSEPEWMKIVWAVRNTEIQHETDLLDVLLEWTRKSPLYQTDEYVIKKYRRKNDHERKNNNNITMGTLWNALKQDKPSLYGTIRKCRWRRTYNANDYTLFVGTCTVDQKKVDDYLCTAFISVNMRGVDRYWGQYMTDDLVTDEYDATEWCLMPCPPFSKNLLKDAYYTTKIQEEEGAMIEKRIRFRDRFKHLFFSGQIARYEKVIFEPSLYPLPSFGSRVFNRFAGFAWTPSSVPLTVVPHNVELILNHLRDVLCNGAQKVYEQVLVWVAHLIQKPNEKVGVCLGMKSEQGTGKNLFWEFIGRVIGKRYFYVANSLDEILQQFNARREGKLLCILDEIQNYGGSYNMADKVKTLISGNEAAINRKFEETYVVKDYCRFVMITNNDWFCKVESSDRRFFIFECAQKRNREYYNVLARAMNDVPTIEATFNFFAHYDLEGKNPRHIPQTKLRNEFKWNNYQSLPFRFLRDICEGTYDAIGVYKDDEQISVHTDDFFQAFITYCEANNEARTMTKRKFNSILHQAKLPAPKNAFVIHKAGYQQRKRGFKFCTNQAKDVIRTFLRQPDFEWNE